MKYGSSITYSVLHTHNIFSFSDMPAVSEHLSFSQTRQSNSAQEKTLTVAMTKPVWMHNGISEKLTTKQKE